MKEVEYSKAAVEVLDILNYTSQEDVRNAPGAFRGREIPAITTFI